MQQTAGSSQAVAAAARTARLGMACRASHHRRLPSCTHGSGPADHNCGVSPPIELPAAQQPPCRPRLQPQGRSVLADWTGAAPRGGSDERQQHRLQGKLRRARRHRWPPGLNNVEHPSNKRTLTTALRACNSFAGIPVRALEDRRRRGVCDLPPLLRICQPQAGAARAGGLALCCTSCCTSLPIPTARPSLPNRATCPARCRWCRGTCWSAPSASWHALLSCRPRRCPTSGAPACCVPAVRLLCACGAHVFKPARPHV